MESTVNTADFERFLVTHTYSVMMRVVEILAVSLD